MTNHDPAVIVTVPHPHPFGMIIPGRSWEIGSGEGYRYGFIGQENSDQIYSNDNAVDFGARIYDSRLGKWLSLDPQARKYPGWSNYVFVRDNPIFKFDPDGETDYDVTYKVTKDAQGNLTKVVADVTIIYQILDVNSSMPVDSPDDLFGNNEKYSVSFTSYYINSKNQEQFPEITVNINIQYEVISSVDQIDDDKNVIVFVDKVKDSGSEAGVLGWGQVDGQAIVLEWSQRYSKHTILHEMGHNLGLYFPGSESKSGSSHSDDPEHLMYESPDGYGSNGTYTNPEDFKAAFGWLVNVRSNGTEHRTDSNGSNAKHSAKELFKEKTKSYDKEKATKKGL